MEVEINNAKGIARVGSESGKKKDKKNGINSLSIYL